MFLFLLSVIVNQTQVKSTEQNNDQKLAFASQFQVDGDLRDEQRSRHESSGNPVIHKEQKISWPVIRSTISRREQYPQRTTAKTYVAAPTEINGERSEVRQTGRYL